MIYVLDACTFINLANGGQLLAVLGLRDSEFLLGHAVRRESASVANVLNNALGSGAIREVDDGILSVDAFMGLKRAYALGDGETECLLAASTLGCAMACDDLAARKAAVALLGDGMVIGSIGLLRKCVQQRVLSSAEAFAAYMQMRRLGAFLPALAASDFA